MRDCDRGSDRWSQKNDRSLFWRRYMYVMKEIGIKNKGCHYRCFLFSNAVILFLKSLIKIGNTSQALKHFEMRQISSYVSCKCQFWLMTTYKMQKQIPSSLLGIYIRIVTLGEKIIIGKKDQSQNSVNFFKFSLLPPPIQNQVSVH